MDKHRTNVFLALVLVLLIVAAVLAWITGSSILRGAPSESAEPVESSGISNIVPGSDKQPEGRVVDESGSISTDSGTDLNMRVDWQVSSASNSELTLSIDLYVRSYALTEGPHSGTIRICGQEYSFVSTAISAPDNGQLNDSLIYQTAVTIPADIGETVAIPISASWNFDGSYGGREIDRLSAEETLTIQG